MTRKISNQEKFDLGYKAIFNSPTNKAPIVSFKAIKGIDQ